MRYFFLSFFLGCIFFTNDAFAQKGFLRGKVFDGETGEPLIGATVAKKGTTIGTVTDFEGNYSLPLEPGNHTVIYQFVSFESTTVENLEIISDKVTTLDVTLKSNVEELGEVVVTAEVIRNSEAAMLTIQKKSANVLDGMSSQTFRKIGDSNLSGAIKRVTGVSIQGGKYVYVRGLGDRYTRTTLNGMTIPGLDPERNDVQIDLFPTTVLENVMVYKTFSPELAGDFSGGTVNVETKSFPEEKVTSLRVGVGYNPSMNLIKDFTTYEGGDLDFLGYDDGTRELPLDVQAEIPRPTSPESNSGPLLEKYTRAFNPKLGAEGKDNFLNTSISFNHGNQLDLANSKFGYSVVLNYQNEYEHYDNTEVSLYFKDVNRDITNLDPQFIKRGSLGRQNTLWSGLVTSALKFRRHEVGFTFLKTQNSIKEATQRITRDLEETSQTGYEDILAFTQRSLTSPTIYGKHNFNKLNVEWSNALTFARVYDPDFRVTLITEVPQYQGSEQVGYRYYISSGQGGNAGRFWRDLNETNENFKVDLTYELKENTKLKFGGAALYKWRTFDTYSYNYSYNRPIENDPNSILTPENLWDEDDNRQGIYVSGNYEAANNYEARSAVNAGYAMGDIFITERLRAIGGLRVEHATMYYTGQDNPGNVIYDDEQTLDEFNLLPSANFVYNLTENSNLRASYGRTLARPSFREKSISQIQDPISGITYSGNIDVEQTNINNFDLRFENFFGREEMVSLSAFYKGFDGHIEQVRFELEPTEVTWRNIGGSNVYGLELELRKNIPYVEGLLFGSNISWAQSRVDMTEIIVSEDPIRGTVTTEYESRLAQSRTDESLNKTRVMTGQAPYLINSFLNYSDSEGRINANLSYNVQGESLAVVGVGQVPDVYVKPFHSLNLNVMYNFGKEKSSQLTFGIDNILGDVREQVWQNYESDEEIFSRFDVGRTFSLKYRYTF